MPFGFGRGKGFGKTVGHGKPERNKGQGRWGYGGPPTNCICPNCGTTVPREPGIPCYQRRCPQCGSFMAREFLNIE